MNVSKFKSLLLQKKSRLKELRRRELENSFCEFVKDAFLVMHQEKIVYNWHIKYICDLLQMEIERIIRREPKTYDIIINVPPRSLKSIIVSQYLIAWAWTKSPKLKFITSSYTLDKSVDNAKNCRRLIDSEWYRDYWGDRIKFSADQNQKREFENDQLGLLKTTSTGGAVTGSGADVIIVDDPTDPLRAASEVERKAANDFFDTTLSTRLNHQDIGIFVVIMQRLHQKDLTGHLISKSPNRFKHVCIPVTETKFVNPPELKKHYKNGYFFPTRFSEKNINAVKSLLGSYAFSGQMLQNPSPEEGGLFKRKYWQYYGHTPQQFDQIVDSWDCSFKDLRTSDYVACTVWGVKDMNRYLLYSYHEKMGFVDTLQKIMQIKDRFKTDTTLIEDKANGTPIIEVLKKKVNGIIPFNPGTQSKQERANAIIVQIESGCVFLPTDSIKTFDVEEYLTELSEFPTGENDDFVDSTTMALLYLLDKSVNILEAMNKLF